ncbi:MAG: hypothetical protein SGI71_07035 [Verrucomicrobiota bacterium]|nr:hypothetical protein [Verrucomicrobiota bacterium]
MAHPLDDELKSDLKLLALELKNLRHAVVNSLGAVYNISELAQRNPVHVDKLCTMVQEKNPEVLDRIRLFSESFQTFAHKAGVTDFNVDSI